MNENSAKVRILRRIWGLIPWIIVFCLIGFVVNLVSDLKAEKARVEEAKKERIKKETPAVKVITLDLRTRVLKDKISLPAEVEPFENLWVKAEVSGQVTRIYVEEGQVVRKGQILVELDNRDYRSRLEGITASYKLATLDYERYSSLAKQNITAKSKLDEIEARLNGLIAQQKEAELALSRTKVRAPIGGRLNKIRSKLGHFVGVGKEVAQILQSGKVKVTVGVPESDVAACFDITQASVIIDALDNRRLTGKKVFLSGEPRSLARLYDLELMVPNPDGHILPGMFARVELIKKVYPKAITVPLYAIITQGDERFVYVEKDGIAEKRTVEIGILDGWQIHVTSGLGQGDKAIVVGHRFLDNGQKVDVIKDVKDPVEIYES